MPKIAFVDKLDPTEDRLLTYTELAKRWSCHPRIAYQRIHDWNVPVVKFNSRAHAIRLSDILRMEAEAMAK